MVLICISLLINDAEYHFHVLFGYSCVVFGEISMESFACFEWIVCFVVVVEF